MKGDMLMGTRHLIGVYNNGEYKIAQYGQWDGYPEGQGVTVLQFLKDNDLVNKLKANLGKCKFLKDKEEVDRLNELLHKGDKATVKWFETYITRDLGADILESVANSTDDEIVLSNHIDFAKDSLFCEWAYIIDFDKNVLEVFKGFNKEKLSPTERFYDANFVSDNEYEPIRLIATFALDDLPEKDDFVLTLNKLARQLDDEDDESVTMESAGA